jgi:hypothetical protein
MGFWSFLLALEVGFLVLIFSGIYDQLKRIADALSKKADEET